jgi:hypothetical protein
MTRAVATIIHAVSPVFSVSSAKAGAAINASNSVSQIDFNFMSGLSSFGECQLGGASSKISPGYRSAMDRIFTRENILDGCLDGRHLMRCVHLLAVKIPHVKHIHHLVHLGGNFGDPDIQAAFE